MYFTDTYVTLSLFSVKNLDKKWQENVIFVEITGFLQEAVINAHSIFRLQCRVSQAHDSYILICNQVFLLSEDPCSILHKHLMPL